MVCSTTMIYFMAVANRLGAHAANQSPDVAKPACRSAGLMEEQAALKAGASVGTPERIH